MRILITGGHFSPAQALISEFKRRGHSIAVAGRRYPFEGDSSESFEYRIAAREKISFFEVKTGRFQRAITIYALSSLIKTPLGFLRAIRITHEFKPDAILTFGGYIGLPIALAGKLLNVPVVLHEQTQKAGLASKIISSLAVKICISFDSSRNYFPKDKTIFTGNPIRREIVSFRPTIVKRKAKGSSTIYVTGGSTGSHRINLLISKVLRALLSDYIVIHQTGENKFQDFEMLNNIVKTLPLNLQKKIIIKNFFEAPELSSIYRKADLIVGRAGINTVCEILFTGRASFLIPIAYGQHGEQLDNARLIKSLGVGEYIEEKDLTPDLFLEKLRMILNNKKEYENNMIHAQSYVVPKASDRIAEVVENLYEQTKKT